MSFDVGTMVDLVVARMRIDKTEPDPNNLRKGWRSDELLIGDVDAFVIGKKNYPGAYAEIGRRVLAEVGDMPEMAVLAKLAILRGERLLPFDAKRARVICELSQDLKVAISALPDGAKKRRCKELFLYNMGIFYDASGCFDEAAKTQEWSAQEAGDNSSSAAISLYCSAYSWLKYGLLIGRPYDELEALFSELEERYQQLAEALRGTELYVQWVEGNCPMQMIMACVWLNRPHSRWREWVEMSLAAPGKLGKAWEIGAGFVRAADYSDHHDQDLEAEITLITVAENSAESPETRATALLMLVRRSTSLKEARGFVDKMPVEGAQHVRAIAKQMLS